jgi:hypothetical protein
LAREIDLEADPKLPTRVTQRVRLLTAEEFAIRDFMAFTGIVRASLRPSPCGTPRYLNRAVAALREVEDVPDHLLAHLSPLGWEHINLTGDYT